MKHIIRYLIRKAGYDVVKYMKPNKSPSVRSEKLTLYDTATGKYYLPSEAYHDVVAGAIRTNQIFEKEVIDCARGFIKPGTTVLDIGSNFGQMAILFSRMVGESGRVYAFDADDFVFDILKKNIEANNADNIKPVFGAVHDQPDETLFFPVQDFVRFGSYGSYGIDYINNKGREVKTVTIDSLKIETPISFMKVDIQGGDLMAMKGAIETIQKNRMPIIFEFEYLFQDDLKLRFQEYVDFVAEIGYTFERVILGHNYLILPK